eukprot:jgi/Mesen1/2465/ME000158S01666
MEKGRGCAPKQGSSHWLDEGLGIQVADERVGEVRGDDARAVLLTPYTPRGVKGWNAAMDATNTTALPAGICATPPSCALM